MNAKRLSILAFVALVGALVPLVYRHAILATAPVGIAVQVGALLFFIWARVTMGWRSFHASANPLESARLVTGGPYGLVRHPIYVSLWAIVWAGVAEHLDWLNTGLALVIAGGLVVRMLLEERLLRVRFPEYGEYAKRTKRIVPFVL